MRSFINILKIAARFDVKSFSGPEEAAKFMGLGLDELDEETLRKRYKKLALQYHPDVNKSEGAEEQFKTLQNANSALEYFLSNMGVGIPYSMQYDEEEEWEEDTEEKESEEERKYREGAEAEEEKFQQEWELFESALKGELDKLNYVDLLIYSINARIEKKNSWSLHTYMHDRELQAFDKDLVDAFIKMDSLLNEASGEMRRFIIGEIFDIEAQILGRMIKTEKADRRRERFVLDFDMSEFSRLPMQTKQNLMEKYQQRKESIVEIRAEDGILVE